MPQLQLPRNPVARVAALVEAGLLVLAAGGIAVAGLTGQDQALTTMLKVSGVLALVHAALVGYRVQEARVDARGKAHQDPTV